MFAILPLWTHLRGTPGASPDQLLSRFGVYRPPIPVERIAAEVGVIIHEPGSPGWNSAVRTSENRADIWLRASATPVEKRWMLAHELGHVLLGPLGQTLAHVGYSTYGNDALASAFAADLLMPLWMCHPYAAAGYASAGLAGLFQAPTELAEQRLAQLYGTR